MSKTETRVYELDLTWLDDVEDYARNNVVTHGNLTDVIGKGFIAADLKSVMVEYKGTAPDYEHYLAPTHVEGPKGKTLVALTVLAGKPGEGGL